MFTYDRFPRKVRAASGLLLAGLILICLPAMISAGPTKKPKSEPQQVSNAQLQQGLHALQVTKKMLEGADHDYGGHRVAAIKAISAAEHQLMLALRSQHKRTNPSGKSTGKAGAGSGRGRQPEPQNISNLQLADAIVVLEQTRTVLEKANHDYGGHRVAAIRDVGGAIKQLKTALKYEKKKR